MSGLFGSANISGKLLTQDNMLGTEGMLLIPRNVQETCKHLSKCSLLTRVTKQTSKFLATSISRTLMYSQHRREGSHAHSHSLHDYMMR